MTFLVQGQVTPDDSVSTVKIKSDAVTSAKIVDDAIDSEHYTDGSIDTAHIAADAVTSAKIADDAIDSEHYTDGSIDTAHIADDQITLAKMASGTDGNIITYDASGNPAAVATGSSGQVLTSAGAGAPPTFAAAAGGAYTSISNTSISAVTNMDVTGFASGTYDNYEIWISNALPATDAQYLEMETSTDGGSSYDTGSSDYSWCMMRVAEDQGSYADGFGDADDSDIAINGPPVIGNATDEGISVTIQCFMPETTEFTTFLVQTIMRDNTGNLQLTYGGGDRQSAADVDALRFHFTSGNFIAQGKIQFLGIAK